MLVLVLVLVLAEEGRGHPVSDCSRALTCCSAPAEYQEFKHSAGHFYGFLSECSNYTHLRPLAILPLDISLSVSCIFLSALPCWWCWCWCGGGEVSQSLTAARAPAVPPAALQLRALCNARGKLCAQQQTPARRRPGPWLVLPCGHNPAHAHVHRDVRSNYF